jgi:hypothetical protein
MTTASLACLVSTARRLPPAVPGAPTTPQPYVARPLLSRYSHAHGQAAAQEPRPETAARSCCRQFVGDENVGRGQRHVAHEAHEHAIRAGVADFRASGPVLDNLVPLAFFAGIQRGGELDDLAGGEVVRFHASNIAQDARLAMTVRRKVSP